MYARLNGLDHAKIAAHLELPESRVRELLHVVALEDVTALFTCFGDDPPRFEVPADSLVVIDEVLDSYPSSRQSLPAHQEAFFAKHGHRPRRRHHDSGRRPAAQRDPLAH